MATSNFGKLFDYDSNKEDWESYIKYLELFLIQTTLSGINHDRTQQRLLSEGANLSLQKVIDISLSLESVIKQEVVIQNKYKQPNEAVSKIEQKAASRNHSGYCFRCGNLHNLKLHQFIDKECFFLKKK